MLLFTPGPTPVLASTRDAMSKETIHHRTPEFEEIFANTKFSGGIGEPYILLSIAI